MWETVNTKAALGTTFGTCGNTTVLLDVPWHRCTRYAAWRCFDARTGVHRQPIQGRAPFELTTATQQLSFAQGLPTTVHADTYAMVLRGGSSRGLASLHERHKHGTRNSMQQTNQPRTAATKEPSMPWYHSLVPLSPQLDVKLRLTAYAQPEGVGFWPSTANAQPCAVAVSRVGLQKSEDRRAAWPVPFLSHANAWCPCM